MIANLTRLLLLIQLTAAACIALLLHVHAGIASTWVAALLGVLTVILVRAFIAANNFRLARRFPCQPKPAALSFRAGLSLYWQEFCATMVSSSWSMPFRRLRSDLQRLSGQIPVLLVHGYGCNSGYWRPLSRHLRAAGISHHAVDLEPILSSIDAYVPQIAAALETLRCASGQSQVIVVAHSMGGLVMRAYQSLHGCDRIVRLITLGTPHHGTGLAQFGVGISARQMRWADGGVEGNANPWLGNLREVENGCGIERLISIYSRHDNIVAPQHSARLDGARNIAFDGIGHVALGSNRRVVACLIEEIQSASDQALNSSPPIQTLLAGRR